jgi:hypothetical protein
VTILIAILAGLIVVPIGIVGVIRFGGTGRPTPQIASWRRFDDTHHWDSSAEDWVHNDNRR